MDGSDASPNQPSIGAASQIRPEGIPERPELDAPGSKFEIQDPGTDDRHVIAAQSTDTRKDADEASIAWQTKPSSTSTRESLAETASSSPARSHHAPTAGQTRSVPLPTSTNEDKNLMQAVIRPLRELNPDATDEGSTGTDKAERSNIKVQSMMDQLGDDEAGLGEGDAISPRLRTASSPLTSSVQHPPRTSSLEQKQNSANSASQGPMRGTDGKTGYSPTDEPISRSPSFLKTINNADSDQHPIAPQSIRFELATPISPKSSIHRSLPPAPEPEPDLPFDFHRFLEQLRHRAADPVAKFLRSFLIEFGKKQWMVHEQVKIVSDFLSFISNKMAQCEVWRGVSDTEFDNAKEGMEKLVMNRLYSQTFSPAISPPPPDVGVKGKRKNTERPNGFGRRGQHQEDIERDEILGQKVRIYGWIQEQHLDIPPVGDSGRKFLSLAQQELLKIKAYRAPRDKVICVLNCCKVIFGLLRNGQYADTSADSFVPFLIYVVLQANPEHLVSNVQYILRFRNQDRLGGEAGYYLSSLMGAIQFIENLDRTVLTVSDEDFEKNVEEAVSAIAEGHKAEHMRQPDAQTPVPAKKFETVERDNHLIGSSINYPSNSESQEDSVAVGGLLRTIQRPLSSIGRIFAEDTMSSQPPATPRRLSPAVFQPPRDNLELQRPNEDNEDGCRADGDAAARQASAEAAEAHRIERAEHNNVVETLSGMFPGLEKDIIDDVVRVKQGRVGLAVDACLALSL